jgi:hypothetical protein
MHGSLPMPILQPLEATTANELVRVALRRQIVLR